MNFKVFDKRYEQRLYMWNEYDIQFRNHEATVPSPVAYRMARIDKEDDFLLEKQIEPYNTDSWKKDKRMIWTSNVSTANGYGMVAENTIRYLQELGVDVTTPGGQSGHPLTGSDNIHPSVLKAIGRTIVPDCLEIQHVQPPQFRTSVVERSWMYTMFETTHTPESWIKMINKAERVIVPSSFLKPLWEEQGVTIPIDVVGHGIDPDVYYFVNRPERDTYTFLHYGQLSIRKGSELVMKAFIDEFKGQSDVKLVLKNIFPWFPKLDVKNVEYINKTLNKQEMLHMLTNADCFVFPTRGEGFGLPPLEAMATGLPTIVTNWGGVADYIDEADTLALGYTLRRSTEFDLIYEKFFAPNENSGLWAEPSYEELKTKMRWCYENRNAAKQMGKQAAARVACDWTWKKRIKLLYNIINENA